MACSLTSITNKLAVRFSAAYHPQHTCNIRCRPNEMCDEFGCFIITDVINKSVIDVLEVSPSDHVRN